MARSFRFLDDIAVADIAFEAEGDTVDELFRAATQALIDTLADSKTVGTSWEKTIEKSEPELGDLLFEWLSEIVYWKDAAGVVFHEAPLTVTHGDGGWNLSATLRGAPVDQQAQALRNDVKGITKHLYRVAQEGPRWTARVVVDV